MLRISGLDLESIQELSPGISDVDVLEQAVESGRVLLTFDRDFGDLIFNRKMTPPAGVVYFRFKTFNPTEPAHILLNFLGTGTIMGKFTVLSRRDIRQRDLPE